MSYDVRLKFVKNTVVGIFATGGFAKSWGDAPQSRTRSVGAVPSCSALVAFSWGHFRRCMGYTCIFIVLSSTFWTLLRIPKSEEAQPPRLALKEPAHDFAFAFAIPRVGLWGGRQD